MQSNSVGTGEPGARWYQRLGGYVALVVVSFFPFVFFFLIVAAIAGVLGKVAGVPTLFRDGALRSDARWYWFVNSPAIWGHAGATVLLAAIWGGIHVREALEHPSSEGRDSRVRFLALNSAPFLVLLVFAAVWPSLRPADPLLPAHQPPPGGLGEVVECLVGIILGALVVVAVGAITFGVRWLLDLPRLRGAAAHVVDWFAWLGTPHGKPKIPHATAGDFLSYLLSVAVISVVGCTWHIILPALGLSLVALTAVAAYFFLLFIRPTFRLLVGLLFAGAMYTSHNDAYFERFPGLDYEHKVGLTSAKSEGAMDPRVPLDAWRSRYLERHPGENPKLVIVSVSGGAYRAGFWTAEVFDRLAGMKYEEGLEDLPGSIRLLTGASGGMVASSYFAALAPKPTSVDPSANPMWPSIPGRMDADIKAYRDARGHQYGKFPTHFPVDLDGLSPVAQQMITRDVPRYLLAPVLTESWGAWTRWDDRGVVLETQWLALARTFSELAADERAGLRPSLILSPMLVETGQPLLISNLDLSPLTKTGEALELFSLFPAARSTLRLQTAVRMNASFPYISPAVSLPTDPPRRVVDAGYYDNYGVAVAAAWLSMPDVRKWVKENTSGVLVIQVRVESPKEKQKPDQQQKEPDNRASVAAQFLTSPIEAAAAARESSMIFRNTEQLIAAGEIVLPGFVRTCSLVYRGEGEVSWYLTQGGLKEMKEALTKADDGVRCVAHEWRAHFPDDPPYTPKSSTSPH